MTRQRYLIILGLLPFGASAGAAEAVPLFTRHVEAVFSRAGCNGGTCHGAVKGQGGFQLSLFGADPEQDRARLLREAGGRRIDRLAPDSSLLLLKATGRIPHEGGQRLAVGGPEYQILRRWIAAGAADDPAEPSRVTRLRVVPADRTARSGQTFRLRVEASFADGTSEDVTGLCSYESLDAAVARVTPQGQVAAHGVGEAAVIVRYRAEPALVRLVVPREGKTTFPNVQANNFIDAHVLAKLRRLGVTPSGLADDSTFLRRVTLDVTGSLPTPGEVRAFLVSKAADRRERKIEELLARPGHAALWTLKFGDLLKASDFGVYADGIRQEIDAPRFQAWIRARLEENLPYDQFVERILTATSREGRDVEAWAREVVDMEEGYGPGRRDLDLYRQRRTLDLYWQRAASSGVTGAMQVAHAFLGLRLECAQCHRHPHDVWQQDDLLSFANFFTRVRKIGFQGDNEKKFPEVAVIFKRLEREAKILADQVKKLREGEYRTLEAEARKAAKDSPAKVKFEEIRQRVARMERQSRLIPEAARRVMHAEVRLLEEGKNFATVTSPIGTQTSKRHRLLGQGKDVVVPGDQDPRQRVMAWMRQKDNPYFARAIVNRVWAHYLGRGLVDPPDNLSPFNPPTHPELLHELATGFVANGYDLRWLHRTILHSRTYQQSSQTNPDNEFDRVNHASFAYRRLPAEVLVDALNQATGTSERMEMEYYHWPRDMRTVEIPYVPRNAFVTFMLSNFGKPKRNAAVQCDCERDDSASVLQVLSLANHPRLMQKIADEKGQVARILREFDDDRSRIEELFLVALGRFPSPAEQGACAKYLSGAATPAKGFQGVLWSLVNTREFLLQH